MQPGELESAGYRFRDMPSALDRASVREVVESTGYFHAHEIDVAVELVDERLAKGLASGYRFLFADRGERLAGYSCYGEIACTRGSFDLYWIVVDRALHGRGLGRELLRRSEAAIAALGGRAIWVETSGREQYQPTRAFYEKSSYERCAVLRDFYADGDDKIIYCRKIEACG